MRIRCEQNLFIQVVIKNKPSEQKYSVFILNYKKLHQRLKEKIRNVITGEKLTKLQIRCQRSFLSCLKSKTKCVLKVGPPPEQLEQSLVLLITKSDNLYFQVGREGV